MIQRGIRFPIIALLFVFGFLFQSEARAAIRVFRTHLPYAPATFDWGTSQTTTDAHILENIAEGLFRNSINGALVPAAAESVQKSKDFKTYTFKIRKSAKWSDGRSVQAQDFIDAWIRVLNPANAANYSHYLSNIKGAKEFAESSDHKVDVLGLKAVSEKVLVVQLEKPIKNWEMNTAFWPLYPIRSDLIEKHGSLWSRPGINLSNGPFVLASYENDAKVTLKKNPHYWNPVGVDQVEMRFIDRLDGPIQEFNQGQLDFIYNIPSEFISKKQKNLIKPYHLDQIFVLGFNGERYPGTNRLFRKAIMHAFDSKKIFPDGTPTQYQLVDNLVWKPYPGFENKKVLDFDLRTARKLLKESGFVSSPDFAIDIVLPLNEPALTIAKSFQKQIQENLGIKVTVNALGGKDMARNFAAGEYHNFLMYWTSKVNKPLDVFEYFSKRSSINRVKSFSDAYEKQIDKFYTIKNESELKELYSKATDIIVRENAMVRPILVPSSLTLHDKKFKGAFINRMGSLILWNLR